MASASQPARRMKIRPTRATALAVAACLVLSRPEWNVLAQNAVPADRVAADDRATPAGEPADQAGTREPEPMSALPAPPRGSLRASVAAASALVPLTTLSSAQRSSSRSMSRAEKWIWVGIAAAGGAIVLLALTKGGEGDTTDITVGTPTVGGPE